MSAKGWGRSDLSASRGQRRAHPGAPQVADQLSTRRLDWPAVEGGVTGIPWRCCGLDEVGRGALAGPLVAAAVVLPDDMRERLGDLAPFLRDSKTVPLARRTQVADLLLTHALIVEVVVISVDDINARGIGWANGEAFRRLIGLVRADGAARRLWLGNQRRLWDAGPPARAAGTRTVRRAPAPVRGYGARAGGRRTAPRAAAGYDRRAAHRRLSASLVCE